MKHTSLNMKSTSSEAKHTTLSARIKFVLERKDPLFDMSQNMLQSHDIIRALLAANRGLADSLTALTDEFGSTLDQYHKLGPTWTLKDGTECFEVDVILDRADQINTARQALSQYAVEFEDL